MEIKNLNKLITLNIKDLYSAESQLIKALPKMAKAASTEKLAQGFTEHLEQTKEHLTGIEKVADTLKISYKGHACKGMQGLIKEGEEFIKAKDKSLFIDAALIGSAQRIEHYEIAAYGTLLSLLKAAGIKKEINLLVKTLEEEKQTDKNLSKIAKRDVNPEIVKENK